MHLVLFNSWWLLPRRKEAGQQMDFMVESVQYEDASIMKKQRSTMTVVELHKNVDD